MVIFGIEKGRFVFKVDSLVVFFFGFIIFFKIMLLILCLILVLRCFNKGVVSF